jgi:hypothetical protein
MRGYNTFVSEHVSDTDETMFDGEIQRLSRYPAACARLPGWCLLNMK